MSRRKCACSGHLGNSRSQHCRLWCFWPWCKMTHVHWIQLQLCLFIPVEHATGEAKLQTDSSVCNQKFIFVWPVRLIASPILSAGDFKIITIVCFANTNWLSSETVNAIYGEQVKSLLGWQSCVDDILLHQNPNMSIWFIFMPSEHYSC